MKVYKVLHVHKRKMSSYNIHCALPEYLDGKVSIRYFKGKITKPTIKGSMLYAFGNESAARKMGSGASSCEVWECEATGVIDCLDPFFGDYRKAQETWDEWNTNGRPAIKASFYTEDYPGCVLCESITPIKRVS